MTLGQKLTFYRKKQGFTQQQLGDTIGITAQAVSKWENDLAEPDLQTLKKLAALYNLTLDVLVSDNELSGEDAALAQAMDAEDIAAAVSESVIEQIKEAAAPQAIGFCTACGIAVTEENLGVKEPKVLCANCKKEADRKEAEAKKQKEAEQKAKETAKVLLRAKRKKRLITASVFGGIAVAITYGISIAQAISQQNTSLILAAFLSSFFVFSFVSLLFFDTPVLDVIVSCATKSFAWPGLIFTWSLDGFIWLIGMKLLFAILGFFLGLFMLLLGLFIGFIISPFVYLWFIPRCLNDIKNDVATPEWE